MAIRTVEGVVARGFRLWNDVNWERKGAPFAGEDKALLFAFFEAGS